MIRAATRAINSRRWSSKAIYQSNTGAMSNTATQQSYKNKGVFGFLDKVNNNQCLLFNL